MLDILFCNRIFGNENLKFIVIFRSSKINAGALEVTPKEFFLGPADSNLISVKTSKLLNVLKNWLYKSQP